MIYKTKQGATFIISLNLKSSLGCQDLKLVPRFDTYLVYIALTAMFA